MANRQIDTLSVEYIEYAVRDLNQASKVYERMGFTCVGQRTESTRRSKLYMQGDIRIVLTVSDSEKDAAYHFNRKHGDGVLTLGYRVGDAAEAYQVALQKGANGVQPHEVIRGNKGAVQHLSAIQVYGDVRNSFISFEGKAKFEDFFSEEMRPLDTVKGRYLQTVDHVTVNVEKGQVERWAKFYEELFGFFQVRYFDIHTERTGLISRAMRNPNGRVTMPFNEPTEDKSQIQEFIDTFKGPGVQHLALHTSNIVLCLDEMVNQGFKFLLVPETYYEEIPKRVPNVREDMKELMRLGILVDGTANGYLLQIFTEPVVGPFFFEFIQRKGDNGFGEGNFRALFEAIERDQMRRGVL
ncbi:MAG: 4-hydroxyphenylpyruvate dioxygenase [Bdellovibrionota bacterium]